MWPQSTAASSAGQSWLTLNCVSLCPSWQETDLAEMWQLQSFLGVSGRTVKVVENICAVWKKLSLALQFPGGVISAVERSQHFQVEAACLTMLQRWLDGEGRQPVTWETLVECLEDIGHCTLASNLRRELEP